MQSKLTSTGTTSYSWDVESRLTSVTLPAGGGTVSFDYDPFGRRIRKTTASGSTIYLYDGANVVEERDASGAVVASYAQGLGIDEPLAMQRGGNVEYYQADGLGSITSLTGSTGQLTATYGYDSFGNTTPTEGIFNPYRYTAREQDPETGLYYYRARYYDPEIGRFISEDPIGFWAGPNFYPYVENNPTLYDDPIGLAKCTLKLEAGAKSVPLDCIPERFVVLAPVHIQVASGNNADPEHHCKNNPDAGCTSTSDIGVLPEGEWGWTRDWTGKKHGRVLEPHFETNRTLIRSHSCDEPFGSSRGPRFCSQGCVTGYAEDIEKLNNLIDAEPGSTLPVTH